MYSTVVHLYHFPGGGGRCCKDTASTVEVLLIPCRPRVREPPRWVHQASSVRVCVRSKVGEGGTGGGTIQTHGYEKGLSYKESKGDPVRSTKSNNKIFKK